MATSKHFKVEGFKEIEKVLGALPGKLAEDKLAQAVGAGARVLVKEARARAPRGGVSSEMSKKYGPLHKKIRARRNKRTNRASVEYVVNEGSAFYGAFLEYGTVHIAPRPWMTPAFDVSGKDAVAKIGTTLGKSLPKLVKELAGKFGSLSKKTRRLLGS